MDIAALSINLNQAKVTQQASIAVMKLAMEVNALDEESRLI